jgi:hypothetical protein
MTVPKTEDILSVAPQQVPDFIRRHAGARTLSRMVKRLNRELLDGDDTASGMAAAALRHLGFMDHRRP